MAALIALLLAIYGGYTIATSIGAEGTEANLRLATGVLIFAIAVPIMLGVSAYLRTQSHKMFVFTMLATGLGVAMFVLLRLTSL